MVSPDVEAHSSIVIILLKGDGHICAVGAVGLHKDVPRSLVGAHVVLVERLPTGEIPHSQQGAAGPCKSDMREDLAVGKASLSDLVHAGNGGAAHEAQLD